MESQEVSASSQRESGRSRVPGRRREERGSKGRSGSQGRGSVRGRSVVAEDEREVLGGMRNILLPRGEGSGRRRSGSEEEGQEREDGKQGAAGLPFAVFGHMDQIRETRRVRAARRKHRTRFEQMVRRLWIRIPQERILPPELSIKLFRTSWLAIFSAMIAHTQGCVSEPEKEIAR